MIPLCIFDQSRFARGVVLSGHTRSNKGEEMKNTDGFPFHVKLSLFGIRNRKGALIQFWSSLCVSVLPLYFGWLGNSLLGTLVYCALVLLTAKWYWSCIRWVDMNARWER
jgi:hypothetical protein